MDARHRLRGADARAEWIFTASTAEDHVDPVAVRADSTVNSVESDGFLLANGQAWSYFASANIGPQPAVGDHVAVYDQSLVDDTKPDTPLLQTTWIDGKSTGQLLLVTPGR